MIIYGTTGLTSTKATGTFNCPRCGTATYQHKVVKQWFTLYFIPLFPTSTVGQYIECRQCKGSYELSVLSYDPDAERREMLLQMKGLFILVMIANGKYHRDEMQVICDMLQEIFEEPTTLEALNEDVQLVHQGGIELHAFAQKAGHELSFEGKALCIQVAYKILMAQGQFRADGEEVLRQLASGLQLSDSQVRHIITEAA